MASATDETALRGIILVNYEEIIFDDLSRDLQIVATDCGMDVARLLMQKLPGITLQISYKAGKSSATYRLLQEKLGDKLTKRIYETLQGLTLNIPKSLPLSFVNRYIKKNSDGKNIKNMAIDLNLSERMIYYLLNRDPQQVNADENNLFKGIIHEK